MHATEGNQADDFGQQADDDAFDGPGGGDSSMDSGADGAPEGDRGDGGADGDESVDSSDTGSGTERTLRVTLSNRHGLHARPAHLFVQTANAYASKLQVGRVEEGGRVDGKSIMGMMMLAAENGVELELTASGPDADAMLRALAELVAANFGEE